MTPAEIREMEKIVDWRLARWKDRGDYEDMRQEALIGAWKALERTRESGHRFSTIVVHAADYAAREWLRSTKSDLPHYGWRRNYPMPEVISVEEMAWRQAAESEEPGYPGGSAQLASPDFAPDLIEAIARRQTWVRAMGSVTPCQAAALRAQHRDGISQQEFAARAGRSWSAINQRIGHARAKLTKLLAEEAS